MTKRTKVPNCTECGESHEISVEARHLAYIELYKAQNAAQNALTWQEERKVFLKAVHDYCSLSRGKIE